MSEGWIKLHRKISDWEWYTDANTSRLFIHLLINANHVPTKWKGVSVPKGGQITGRKGLAEQTGLSEQQVRTALEKLKTTKEITIKAHNKFSVITISKWEDYQPDNQQVTNNQPTDNQQVTTDKNDNNDKKVKKVYTDEFELFWKSWKAYKTGKGDKQDASPFYEQAAKEIGHEEIIRISGEYCKFCEITDCNTKNVFRWFKKRGWENDYTIPKGAGNPKTGGSSGDRPSYSNTILSAAQKARESLVPCGQEWDGEDSFAGFDEEGDSDSRLLRIAGDQGHDNELPGEVGDKEADG